MSPDNLFGNDFSEIVTTSVHRIPRSVQTAHNLCFQLIHFIYFVLFETVGRCLRFINMLYLSRLFSACRYSFILPEYTSLFYTNRHIIILAIVTLHSFYPFMLLQFGMPLIFCWRFFLYTLFANICYLYIEATEAQSETNITSAFCASNIHNDYLLNTVIIILASI